MSMTAAAGGDQRISDAEKGPSRIQFSLDGPFLLYRTAETLVYPYIRDFYAATHAIPPTYAVAAMQVARSLIFVSAA